MRKFADEAGCLQAARQAAGGHEELHREAGDEVHEEHPADVVKADGPVLHERLPLALRPDDLDLCKCLGIANLLYCNFWRARFRLYQNRFLQVNNAKYEFFSIFSRCVNSAEAWQKPGNLTDAGIIIVHC